ncbi:MAG: hypothetical protein NZ742_07505 [Acidobacteria bacterium]|nr:hypothetical protein [Acidobacteriota bacterium]MDW7984673.1 hypothetical protein [Acidobacteriota bacterium]
MPEVLTKYPDVVLRVLQGNDARCGPRVTPRILQQCPRDRFCTLETGEICVYGLPDIPKMTQIRSEELAAVVCPPKTSAAAAVPGGLESIGLALVFFLGFGIGRLLGRRTAQKG